MPAYPVAPAVFCANHRSGAEVLRREQVCAKRRLQRLAHNRCPQTGQGAPLCNLDVAATHACGQQKDGK